MAWHVQSLVWSIRSLAKVDARVSTAAVLALRDSDLLNMMRIYLECPAHAEDAVVCLLW